MQMSALEEEYITVAEAATLLRVAPSTIRRWIREGDLPAFRMGKRRLALRRSDVDARIVPIRPGVALRHHPIYRSIADIPALTPEEIEQGLVAMEEAQRISKQILARRGGKPFPPSWKVLNDLRDERTRQLGG